MEPAPARNVLRENNTCEDTMADGNSGNGGLYFIVGALCVAVAVGAFFLFGGNLGQSTAQAPAAAPAAPAAAPTKNVTIEKIEVERPDRRDDRRDRR
jgi:hypothetical protein